MLIVTKDAPVFELRTEDRFTPDLRVSVLPSPLFANEFYELSIEIPDSRLFGRRFFESRFATSSGEFELTLSKSNTNSGSSSKRGCCTLVT